MVAAAPAMASRTGRLVFVGFLEGLKELEQLDPPVSWESKGNPPPVMPRKAHPQRKSNKVFWRDFINRRCPLLGPAISWGVWTVALEGSGFV